MLIRAHLIVLFGLVLATQAPAQAADPKPVRPAIRVVKLSGTPKERGIAHGKEMKAEIHALVKLWKADLKKTYRCDPDEFIARFYDNTEFEEAIDKWTPGLLDEVRGIAEGAGIDYETMFVFQLIDEVWAQGKTVMQADKCTAIGVDRRDGQPTIVAQNLDIPKWYHGYQTLLHITDTEAKLQTFVVTLPGLVAANGMNSARVAVVVNTILQVRPCKDGLPVAFVVRGVLNQQDWHKARQFLYDVRHASGQNYTIGGRDVAHSYECSAHRVLRYRPFPGGTFTFHTNHPLVNEEWSEPFLSRAKQAGKPPREMLRPCPRFESLQRRLKKGVVATLDTVLAALRSKDSTVPICNAHTFVCTIMLLGGEPELRISAGGADTNEFHTFRFKGKPR